MTMKDLIRMATVLAEELEEGDRSINKRQINRVLTALYLSIGRGADSQVVEELMERIANANNALHPVVD